MAKSAKPGVKVITGKLGRRPRKGEVPAHLLNAKKVGNGQRQRELDPEGLLPSERLFVEEYLIDFNGKRAWLRAGGSYYTDVHEILSRTQVAEAIDRRLAKKARETEEKVAEVQEELHNIATSKINEFRLSPTGKLEVAEGIDEKRMGAVSSIELITSSFEDSEGKVKETQRAKIRLWDKNAGARIYLQSQGRLVERVGGPDGEPLQSQLGIDELRQMLKAAKGIDPTKEESA